MSNLTDRLRKYRIRETKLNHKINLFDKSADRIDELELIVEEVEATHKWLDAHDVARHKDGEDHTIVGRLMILVGRGKKMLDGLEAENKILRDYEKRRIYASPKRFQQLWSAEAKAKKLEVENKRLKLAISYCPNCGEHGGEHDQQCPKHEVIE